MKTNLSTFLLMLFAVSCAHSEKVKKDHLLPGLCEQEFKSLELSPGQSIWQGITETSGTGTSYLITGLAYSTDFIIRFSSGVLGGIVICSPILALEVTSRGQTRFASGDCIGNAGRMIYENVDPRLGPKLRKHTQKWQCPNVDHIALGLLKVSQCYHDRGEPLLAHRQLQKIKDSPVFKRCLSDKGKARVKEFGRKHAGPR